MKSNRILSFTFFTFNIVWGKLEGGGAPTSWLIRPPVIDLAPTNCSSYSMANLAIWAPTCTLCVLHQGTWLSTHPFTHARSVECMCVVLRIVPSGGLAILVWSARVIASWGVVSNDGWTGGRKPTTSWGWFYSSHFFHGFNPTFLSCSKHSELGFPCLSQDAVFSDRAHTIIVQ
jgi:hypothetical protein